MPTYEYECAGCGHRFEVFQSIKDGALRKCPGCGKLKLQRLISAGAGVIFKGSGFYETDYKRSAAGKEKGESKSAERDGAKTESGGREEKGKAGEDKSGKSGKSDKSDKSDESSGGGDASEAAD